MPFPVEKDDQAHETGASGVGLRGPPSSKCKLDAST